MKSVQTFMFLFLACAISTGQPQIKSFSVFEPNGGRLDVMQRSPYYVAFDRKAADGHYDVWYTDLNRTFTKCVNCGNSTFPTRNVGNPAWDPTGRYLLVQVEKQVHLPVTSAPANPGVGGFSDLYVYDFQTKKATNLFSNPDTLDYAVLHPHFSHDGKKITWGEMYERPSFSSPELRIGKWSLAVADFDTSGRVPALKNIRYIIPSIPTWYENHGFTPDDTRLIFTSPFAVGVDPITSSNEFTYNLQSRVSTQLTTQGYNEHAHMSPDLAYFTYLNRYSSSATATSTQTFSLTAFVDSLSSSSCEPSYVASWFGGELWAMNANGSGKFPLTSFNTPGSSMQYCEMTSSGKCCFTGTAADHEWIGSKEILLYVIFRAASVPEQIYRIKLQ